MMFPNSLRLQIVVTAFVILCGSSVCINCVFHKW